MDRFAAALVDRAARSLPLVLWLTLGSLVLGFATKTPCLSSYPARHPPTGCFNDIQLLWDTRHLAQHLLPYQGTVTTVPFRQGDTINAVLAAGQVEYPVVTGLFIWLTSLLASGRAGYLVVSALALAPFALLTSRVLHSLAPRRVLVFALAPAVAGEAFINWDLLPVTATAVGLWAWHRGRAGAAAAALAVGASAKLWPGFLLVPLLLHLLLEGRRTTAVRVFGVAAATTAVLNGPFLIANAAGWAGPFVAQSARQNDVTTNSLWFFLARHSPISAINVMSLAAVLAAWTVLLLVGMRRRRASGVLAWLQVGAAMVSSYVVLGRADSPQYTLCLLPFLVVLAVPRRWVTVFLLSDAWLWLQWSYLHRLTRWAMPPAQVTRILVVACMTLVLLNAANALSSANTPAPDPGPDPATTGHGSPAPQQD